MIAELPQTLPREGPYVPMTERRRIMWEEIGTKLGIPGEKASALYLGTNYPVGCSLPQFRDLVLRGEITLEDLTSRQIRKPALPENEEEQNEVNVVDKILDSIDEKIWGLRQIIQVGDQIEADETKTGIFSKTQYLTKGKLYTIIALGEDGPVEFTAITNCDLPEPDKQYVPSCGIRALYRNGEIIWSCPSTEAIIHMERFHEFCKGLETRNPKLKFTGFQTVCHGTQKRKITQIFAHLEGHSTIALNPQNVGLPETYTQIPKHLYVTIVEEAQETTKILSDTFGKKPRRLSLHYKDTRYSLSELSAVVGVLSH